MNENYKIPAPCPLAILFSSQSMQHTWTWCICHKDNPPSVTLEEGRKERMNENKIKL